MKQIAGYISNYFRQVNKWVLLLCTVQTASLIFLNYRYSLEKVLTSHWNLVGHYFLFLFAFGLPYLFYLIIEKKDFLQRQDFLLLLLIAPLVFAIKMSMNTRLNFTTDLNWNAYWNKVIF